MANKRQSLDLRRCSECACLNLRKATRAITQLYDRAFQPHGLRATQFQILVPIANRSPITISRLAKLLIMDRTTLSRDLGPLKKRGWVRVRAGQDRRTRTVELTAGGRRLLQSAFPAWRRTQQKVVDGLGLGSFRGLLDNLSSSVSVAKSKM